MSGPIWIQTVCNGYQQMTQAGKEFKVEIFPHTSDLDQSFMYEPLQKELHSDSKLAVGI